MPGPVSDSYDPEFGTGANADTVSKALAKVRDRIAIEIGDPSLLPIVDIAESLLNGDPDQITPITLSFREMRIIRFALNRALESI